MTYFTIHIDVTSLYVDNMQLLVQDVTSKYQQMEIICIPTVKSSPFSKDLKYVYPQTLKYMENQHFHTMFASMWMSMKIPSSVETHEVSAPATNDSYSRRHYYYLA
jgi:hypothetical protein